MQHYQVNTQNLERFLNVPPTDDVYYNNINKELPVGSSNGLSYLSDGSGAVLKIQFVKKNYLRKPEGEQGSFTQTGRLGDVMKESLDVVKIAAFNYVT
mmetsp:Transcript_34657/g.53052  ORF Transcript_34657/g.53052 Transcript_34657/m.53052 type:complete len:98 (+) Transcript_34657:2380-2673(+)